MRGIFWSHQFHDIKEDDGAGTNPGDEIDDDHDGTEHDTVGAPLARPEDTQEDNLEDDAEDVDDACNYRWLNHCRLGHAPNHTKMEQKVHKQKPL